MTAILCFAAAALTFVSVVGVPVRSIKLGILQLVRFRVAGTPTQIGLLPLICSVTLGDGDPEYRLAPQYQIMFMLAGVIGLTLAALLIGPAEFATHFGQVAVNLYEGALSPRHRGAQIVRAGWDMLINAPIPTTMGWIAMVNLVINCLPIPPTPGGCILLAVFQAMTGPHRRPGPFSQLALLAGLVFCIALLILWTIAVGYAMFASAV